MKKAKVSKYGQWKYPGEDTIIPNANGSITMKGVPYPVLGIDDQGNRQMMMPGGEYQFPGNSVYEIPMAKNGGTKKVKIKSLPKAQSYGTQKDVERSWANSSHNSNMDIVSRGTDNAPFLFGVNTDVIDISNPNRWSWKNAPTLEPVTLDLNDPDYKKYKQWETVYNLDQQYMPWLVNRLNDPSIPISEKSHGPNWLPGSNYNDAESLELSEIYDSRFLEDPSIKNNYDLSLLNDNYHYGDIINESQYDFANAALPIWAVTVDKDSTPRDRKFNYLHQFFEIAPPAIYLKGKDLTPTALPQVDIQPQLQNMAPLADGSKVQRVTINTPQGDMVRVQDPKTKKFIRWENVSGESVDFDNEDVGGASSDFPQIQKSKSRPSFEYGGSLPKAQIGAEEARRLSDQLARKQRWHSRNPRNVYYTDIDEFARANQAEADSLHAGMSTGFLDMMINNERQSPRSFYHDPRLSAPRDSPINNSNTFINHVTNEVIRPQRVRYETIVDRLNNINQIRVNDYKWPETHAVYKEEIKPKMIEAKPFVMPQVDIVPQLGNIAELPIPKGSQKQRVVVNTPQGDMVRVQDPKTKKFIRWEHTSGESVDFEKKPTGNTTDDFPEMKRIPTPSFVYGGVPRAQGGFPSDYESFLRYSETAPENRRPTAEWQYGNPRQYDHYGMWDALGKPEDFDQALEMNPHWQPDPYDNMYHGFSTNPNTGVWLKSHIPGESHPGDTGWMEYKDFMLSNDQNWGGKNQNLVYDPDLQRMRYVERKKTGGSIRQVKIKSLPKAQSLGSIANMMQQVGYKPTTAPPLEYQMESVGYKNPSLTPSVPLQMQSVGYKSVPEFDIYQQLEKAGFKEPVSIYDEMEKFPAKVAEAVAPIDYGPFTIPEDYYTRLMQEENSINAGLKDGRYYQYPSHEKGTDTIGYGHKLTEEEAKAGKFNKGLTKEQAIELMRKDAADHLIRAKQQFNEEHGSGSFDKLHPDLKVLALDFVYNGIGINEFPNFFGAAKKYSTTKNDDAKKAAFDKMMSEYMRYDNNKDPLVSRNEYTKYVLENMKKTGGELSKAQTMGQFSDWRNILNYNAAEPKQNLVGDVRKLKVQPAVAESTNRDITHQIPTNTEELKAEKAAQAAYDALPEALKRRDTLTADKRSDTEKFARRAWTAVSQPMTTLEALNRGYDIPSGYMGMHDAYEGYGVGSSMTSAVDIPAGIIGFIGNAANRQGTQLIDNPGEYVLTNTLGLFDPNYRNKAVSNWLDLAGVIPATRAASPVLRNAGKSVITRTGEVKNIIRPPKLSMNDASLYDAGKSERMMKFIFDNNYRKNASELDIKYWNWLYPHNDSKVLQRIANKLDYPVELGSIGDMQGGFGTVVPTTHDPTKLVKFGTLLPWESEAPGIFSKLDEIGKLNVDPHLGLPLKSHVFPDLQLDIAFNQGPGSAVQILNKIPGVPLRKFAQSSPENLEILKNSITDQSIQNTRDRLSFLQRNNLGVDWQNPDNFLFDPATGEVGVVDIAAMPRKVTGPDGAGIRWFNTLGANYGDIYEKAMGAVIGDPIRASMRIKPVIGQIEPIIQRTPGYSYILERQGYPKVWKTNSQGQQIWESAFEPKVKRPSLETLLYQIEKAKAQIPATSKNTGSIKREGGTASKKKQPGFQVLTDANGKYVFVKT